MSETMKQTLKEWRLAARMTQQDAAEAAGVDHTYLSKIENGHMEPSVELVERLAVVYRRHPTDADEVVLESGRLPSWVEPLLTSNPHLVRNLRLKRSASRPFAQITPPEYA